MSAPFGGNSGKDAVASNAATAGEGAAAAAAAAAAAGKGPKRPVSQGSGPEEEHAAVAKRPSLQPAGEGGDGGRGSSAGSASTAVVGPEEGSAVGPTPAAGGVAMAAGGEGAGRWTGCCDAGRARLGCWVGQHR